MRPEAVLRQMVQDGRISELTDEELQHMNELTNVSAAPVKGAGAPGERIVRADVPESMLPPKDRTGGQVAGDVAAGAASMVLPMAVPGVGILPAATRIALSAMPESLRAMLAGEGQQGAVGEAALQGVAEAAPSVMRGGIRTGLALKGVPRKARREVARAFSDVAEKSPQLPLRLGPAMRQPSLGSTERIGGMIGPAAEKAQAARVATPGHVDLDKVLTGTTAKIGNQRGLDPQTPMSSLRRLHAGERRSLAENTARFGGPQVNLGQLGTLTGDLQGKGRKVIEQKMKGAPISVGRELEGQLAAEQGLQGRDILKSLVPGEADNTKMIEDLYKMLRGSEMAGGDVGALNKLGVMGMGGGFGSGTVGAASSLAGFESGPARSIGSLLGLILANPQNISRTTNAVSRGMRAAPTAVRGTNLVWDLNELADKLGLPGE